MGEDKVRAQTVTCRDAAKEVDRLCTGMLHSRVR